LFVEFITVTGSIFVVDKIANEIINDMVENEIVITVRSTTESDDLITNSFNHS